MKTRDHATKCPDCGRDIDEHDDPRLLQEYGVCVPTVWGGQGHTEDEAEQSGLVVGVALIIGAVMVVCAITFAVLS